MRLLTGTVMPPMRCVTAGSLGEEALLLPVESQSDGVFDDTDVACWNWR